MIKSKKFILIASIIATVLVALGGTYAWYVWSTDDSNRTKIVTNVGAAYVYYTDGDDITGAKLKPVSSYTAGISKTVTVISDNPGVSFNLYLDIVTLDDGLKEESFKYAVYNGQNTKLTEGNFSTSSLNSRLVNCTTNNSSHIVLLQNQTVMLSESSYTGTSTYTLYIWIDGNVDNPSTMQNQNFKFHLHADGQNALVQEAKDPVLPSQTNTLSYNLISNYLNSSKTEVTNGGTTYKYDTAHNLMSDVGGNLRFYGSNPSNNYIYFNCSDYRSQADDTCDLWRIIGVVDGKIKIIRTKPIESLAWDQDKNQDSTKTTYSNNWETSSLQLFLNGLYYNRGTTESHTYYSGSSGTTTTTLDLTNIGITEATRTNNLISTSTWYLGSWWTSARIYANNIYNYERTNKVGTTSTIYGTNPFTIEANIGLMSASDYGYAADFTKCQGTLTEFNNCFGNNWLYYGATWLLNSHSQQNSVMHILGSSGNILSAGNAYDAKYVLPVLYLSPELGASGSGSSDDPYKLIVG